MDADVLFRSILCNSETEQKSITFSITSSSDSNCSQTVKKTTENHPVKTIITDYYL